jgi:outer membrane protein OmpA-like peptidoglycan-associated protein
MAGKGGGATASSMTDIMASLVAVFVLLFVAAQNNRGQGVVSARDVLMRRLREALPAAGIDRAAIDSVPNDPSTVVIILPDSVLFDRGAAQMSPGGRNVVRTATPILARVLCEQETRRSLDQMVVEGHTDNTVPAGSSPDAGRMYNLRLSQLRSMDFVTTSTAALGVGAEADLECYLGLVSATGRGQENPVPGVPPDAPPQRRVVLRLRLKTEPSDSVRLRVDSVPGGQHASGT